MNIIEFARHAKVSTATISRAFHEPDKLRPETRERILQLAREAGYYPSPSGRALKRGRHDVLGLVWPLEVEGAEAAFAQRVLAAITCHLVANDLDLLVCPLDRRDPATLEHAQRTLRRSRADAWLLLYPRRGDALAETLAATRKPVVCLMGQVLEQPAWKWVALDQRGWLDDALVRLKASGARNVLFLGARPGEPDHGQRMRAFTELAPKHFGKRHSELPGWPPSQEALRSCLKNTPVDAVIGVDDRAALLALGMCRELGLDVPGRVKIVGIDDIAEARFAHPPLSSYRQPLEEMAGHAVDLALGRKQRSRVFQATFVARDTLT